MTEIKLDIKEIRKNLFLLDEGGMSTGYLIAGEKMACLIDTMNGFTDLKKVCQSLTDKPVILKNYCSWKKKQTLFFTVIPTIMMTFLCFRQCTKEH